MKRPDFLWLGTLLIAAALIWLEDRAWLPEASETLPVLIALPLFVWLGAPWRLRSAPFQLPGRTLAGAGMLLALGCLLNSTFLLAAAWTLALWSWLRTRVISEGAGLGHLVLLPLMAFPWLRLDFAPIGWWFRVSAAWVADHLYGALGFAVMRQGTALLVHGLPVEVAAACSGMNALQTLLIAGLVLAWLELRGSRWFWLALATLPALAWIANVLRICSTVAFALSWGAGSTGGWLHAAGGWMVLMLVFLGWWLILGAGCQRFAARRVAV
jgi:exosortase/archaeosortase family protein